MDDLAIILLSLVLGLFVYGTKEVWGGLVIVMGWLALGLIRWAVYDVPMWAIQSVLVWVQENVREALEPFSVPYDIRKRERWAKKHYGHGWHGYNRRVYGNWWWKSWFNEAKLKELAQARDNSKGGVSK